MFLWDRNRGREVLSTDSIIGLQSSGRRFSVDWTHLLGKLPASWAWRRHLLFSTHHNCRSPDLLCVLERRGTAALDSEGDLGAGPCTVLRQFAWTAAPWMGPSHWRSPRIDATASCPKHWWHSPSLSSFQRNGSKQMDTSHRITTSLFPV